jgi:hypothetical protein
MTAISYILATLDTLSRRTATFNKGNLGQRSDQSSLVTDFSSQLQKSNTGEAGLSGVVPARYPELGGSWMFAAVRTFRTLPIKLHQQM